MPDPKRFLAKMPWYAIETQEHPQGEFVLYLDYAKLKKEFNDWITMNSATTEHNEFMYNQAVEQRMAAIKTEVERLTKELEKQDLLLAMANALSQAAKKGGQP